MKGLAAIGWSDVVVKSGVAIRRLLYTTIDANGDPTVASGLLALPIDIEPVGVVSFEHGTSAEKSNVPSAPGSGEGQVISALFASGGFALVAPDYVGLGLSPGPHPYLHATTEASASLDLLTAGAQLGSDAELPADRVANGILVLAADLPLNAVPTLTPRRAVTVTDIAVAADAYLRKDLNLSDPKPYR